MKVFFHKGALARFSVIFFFFSPKGNKGEHGADGEIGQKGDQVRAYFIINCSP